MNKIFRFFTALLAILLVAVLAVGYVWRGEVRSVASVKSVDGNRYLYEMVYLAPYDLDEVIKSDIAANSDLLNYVVGKIAKGLPVSISTSSKADEGEHCTSFQAKKAGSDSYLYGRNYDYFKNPTLVVHSNPKNGYASLAVCDMSHFGFSLEKLPDNVANKILCLASIYAPMDGINEKGLCTSIMALPKMPAYQNTGKHKVGTSILMRLFLDRCATVDEALELLGTIDVCHDQQAGAGYHYMVADAQGNCAVIEFDPQDGWKTMITRKADGRQSMQVTNHLLAPQYYTEEPDPEVGNPHSKSWWRYNQVREYLAARQGTITVDEAQQCLANVHWEEFIWDNGMVEDTQYSNVYDQSALELRLRPWNDFEKTYLFEVR